MELFGPMLDSLYGFWTKIVEYLPRLLAAFVLLVLGWAVAKLLRKGIIRLLRALQFDTLAEKAGFEDFLVRGGVQYTTVTILASLVYWMLMFIVILAALNSLGLEAAAELVNRVVLYIPNVMVAILALLFGSLLGRFVQAAVAAYLNNVGVEGAGAISMLAQWAIMLFVTFVALEQLSIGGQILVSAFQLAFGALCLALALAFGFGGRRWAAHVLDKLWRQ